jgi:phage-related protein
MKGVKFGGLHSYYEWGLILVEKELKSPKAKTYTVELEGSNGVLDFTDFFGAVKYENRKLTFKFIKPQIVPDGFLSLYSLVQNTLHGKKMQVILDDDPAYFYYGRISINDWKSNKGIGEIVIEVDAEPYKQSISETVVTQTVKGSASITIDNDKMPVMPTITSNAEFLIDFGSYNEVYSAGTFQIPELELGEGSNYIYVEGTGTITFKYRKGRL